MITANEQMEDQRRLEKTWTIPLEGQRLQSLTEGAQADEHKCIDCGSLELDDDRPRCGPCQEVQNFEEQEERTRQYWANYIENDGRVERDTRNSDYMRDCRVK